jgi:RES domain-containing protein
MIVYRVCGAKYSTIISGEGARKQKNNRWNSFGTPMVYTSESPALCAVEMHQYLPPSFPPMGYTLLEIEIPDTEPLVIGNSFFENVSWIGNLRNSQSLGDYFIRENQYLVMKVPSAMISSCYNYLINPNHQDFNQVKIINTMTFPIAGKLFDK